MKQKETPLFKAFNYFNKAALDIADSFGNLSVCKHTVALVQAAMKDVTSGKPLRGLRGVNEIAYSFFKREPK